MEGPRFGVPIGEMFLTFYICCESIGGIKGILARSHKVLGRSPFNTEDFRRHLAAAQIQRAWRAVLAQRQLADDHYYSTEFDVAWKGRSFVNSGIERESSRRSFAPKYSTRNAHSRRGNMATENKQPSANLLQGRVDENSRRRSESQVGSAMRELTGQRVAIGIIVALFFTVLFTYVEKDATRASTMIVLHNQTGNDAFVDKSLQAARSSSIPDLFYYKLTNGEVREFPVVEAGKNPDSLRARERMRITITDYLNHTTIGLFSLRDERREEALVSLLSTIFILFVWFFGVTAFAGPVMVLVVIPIERMVRLLAMLMVDPLGYQSTSRYKRFVQEENEITKNTRWTKEILKGMETSFLMSTILRIGSLMKVGFGSAGVEIIRNNLEKGQSENMLILSSQGSTVSCIFLFCDIRNFTDATECLQEEVFVFTNRIAAVVHSNCHAYGGSANKNVGDAFLLSWRLDEDNSPGQDSFSSKSGQGFIAKNNQADKALLSVVKICMALYYDEHYIEAMTATAREALVTKLQNRKGPLVQMGFGLHAGRAVQGAIGSQRKIDATYVSEAVERAEFLESSTKKYGLKMLMSDNFHRLLHPANRRRCRKIDQILIRDDDDDEDDNDVRGEIIELFTFDTDIDALWVEDKRKVSKSDGIDSDAASDTGSRRGALGKVPRNKRISMRIVMSNRDDSEDISQSGFLVGDAARSHTERVDADGVRPPKLVLPTGPALYNANVWTSEDMRTIRQLYSDGLFFQKFTSGLQSFYAKEWEYARQCFSVILDRFEDGPSRYFMDQIEKHGGKPPRNFLGYGIE
jgi:class 3 adenylate cyclase